MTVMAARKSTVCHPQAGNQNGWWVIQSKGLIMGVGGRGAMVLQWRRNPPFLCLSSYWDDAHLNWGGSLAFLRQFKC